ncbi:MAG: universal stress protein [Propionibacteriales bacterium]|nr:universal stress protein [Propionibacteriales bacterium]
MIVTGYTATESSAAALRLAAKLAVARDEEILIVHAFDVPAVNVAMGPAVVPPTTEEVNEWCADVVAEAEQLARDGGAPSVSSIVRLGPPASVLVAEAGPEDLVVVGTRGRSELASVLLGSVSYQVTAHSPCPVIVVRSKCDFANPDGAVVVGVDGSEASAKAVEFAIRWSLKAGRPLTLVAAWQNPTMVGLPGAWVYASTEDDAAAVEQATMTMMAELRDRISTYHPELTVTSKVVADDPAHALTEASAEASLLVVGSRGHGGFVGLVLGSISHRVLHDAPVPVAVVR